MALENAQKLENGTKLVAVRKLTDSTIVVLRVVAFLATVSATVVMAMNKETKSIVVATVGTTPLSVTLTAKFQHTPANVYFVIANGIASFHNLFMMAVHFFGDHTFKDKGLQLVMVAILDVMIVALLSSGDGAATFMAQLGKKGNSHAMWNKICDKFEKFCDHAGGAIIASYIGLILLLVITALSIIKLLKRN
ncbi:hypothetical protein ACFX14_004642 [Malus domestica]